MGGKRRSGKGGKRKRDDVGEKGEKREGKGEGGGGGEGES